MGFLKVSIKFVKTKKIRAMQLELLRYINHAVSVEIALFTGIKQNEAVKASNFENNGDSSTAELKPKRYKDSSLQKAGVEIRPVGLLSIARSSIQSERIVIKNNGRK